MIVLGILWRELLRALGLIEYWDALWEVREKKRNRRQLYRWLNDGKDLWSGKLADPVVMLCRLCLKEALKYKATKIEFNWYRGKQEPCIVITGEDGPLDCLGEHCPLVKEMMETFIGVATIKQGLSLDERFDGKWSRRLELKKKDYEGTVLEICHEFVGLDALLTKLDEICPDDKTELDDRNVAMLRSTVEESKQQLLTITICRA